MTTRQKQKLMMESEFDEFDEVDRKKESLSEEGDLSDVSDNEDVDDRLVVHLNMKRLQVWNDYFYQMVMVKVMMMVAIMII